MRIIDRKALQAEATRKEATMQAAQDYVTNLHKTAEDHEAFTFNSFAARQAELGNSSFEFLFGQKIDYSEFRKSVRKAGYKVSRVVAGDVTGIARLAVTL